MRKEKSSSMQRRHRHERKRILFTFFLCIIIVIWNIIAWLILEEEQYNNDIIMGTTTKKNNNNDSENINICTFEDLKQSFGKTTTTTQEDKENCWSLKKNILRIPRNSIINRNNMKPLGHGFRGGVHKALIRLSTTTTCWAAIKTDFCYSMNLFQYKNLMDGWRTNCLADGTISLFNTKSFLGSEYTGALLFGLLQQQEQQERSTLTSTGLLPTFGIIMADDNQRLSSLSSLLRSKFISGSPHPDSSVLGVVMPLTKFVPLSEEIVRMEEEDQENNKNNNLLLENNDVATVANMMLSSANGLKVIHDLGFAHQDVQAKNIGILQEQHDRTFDYYSSNSTFMIDNSYLSKVSTCRHATACNYCGSSASSTASTTDENDDEYLSTFRLLNEEKDPQYVDVRNYVQAIISLTTAGMKNNNYNQAQLTRIQKFHSDLQDCKTSTDLVNMLIQYSK